MSINKVLKVKSDSELLSFIINQTPELASEIDLPRQGESIAKYGQLIVHNDRYKNSFINTINLIGLTVIDRNYWENPWEIFTNRGSLAMGQSVREMLVDIADVFDYNKYANDEKHFLANVVPNVFQYIHDVNYQKFYKTTTSDEQISMAFVTEGGLFDLIEKIIGSLYEGYKYDNYIASKYMLCRRIIDGTITAVKIDNYANLTPRERVSRLKAVSNKMTFRNPNYNPAGARVATEFNHQIAILNTDFEADMSTEVLATSFFRNDAEMKSRLALCDGFGNHDEERLAMLLGDGYIPFTDAEKTALAKIPCVLIDDEFFQNRNYALDTQADTKATQFYNPETLKNNHWLHTWKVLSTSPYKSACVMVTDTPSVVSITLSPAESTVSAGLDVQIQAVVSTIGFANKAVTYEVEEAPGEQEGSPVTVDLTGKVHIPVDYEATDVEDPNPIIIKAVSVFDNTVTQTASITVL